MPRLSTKRCTALKLILLADSNLNSKQFISFKIQIMNTKKILTLLLLLFMAGRSIAQPPPILDSIYGYVFRDIDGDCIQDAFETGLENWAIWAVSWDSIGGPDTLIGLTDANGLYTITVPFPNAGNVAYFFNAYPPNDNNGYCVQTCENYQEIFPGPSGGNTFTLEANFGYYCDTMPFCPIIDVDIATPILRPCFVSTYFVDYKNLGSIPAPDAYIDVTFDLPLQVLSASEPYSLIGNVYRFQLGTLQAFAQGSFSIEVFTPCDEPVGKTYCAEAHAYPDTCITPPGANWDGSKIEVSAFCENDVVSFSLKNVGTGDMTNMLEYIVVEDNVLLMQTPGQFQLNAGDELLLPYPADGSFFRLEAQQSPGYPGFSQPIAWAEGCGGNGSLSLGFVNQYPLGDNAPWIDIFCLESVASFDPNDKQGFPRGVGDEHYIDQNVDLEYMIRFQNTGTASAINIEIRDTLQVQWLDPNTIRPGAGSHPYQFDMQGNGVVVFKYQNINLPDSNANFDASQGFVKFRINQRKDVPLETEIKNTAAIFFDFNAPIITNQTLHTVGKDFLVLSNTQAILDPRIQVQLMPNPTIGQVQVLAKGLENTPSALTFRLVSMLGEQVLTGIFDGSNFTFDASQLPQGVYAYEIRNNGQLAATGKVLKM